MNGRVGLTILFVVCSVLNAESANAKESERSLENDTIVLGQPADAPQDKTDEARESPPTEAEPVEVEPVEASQVPEEGPTSDAEQKRERIVLTISGGVSLGAYEAGLNWTLLHLIRASQDPSNAAAFKSQLDLVSATGASAGNINVFLSAVEWFDRSATPDPIDNLFWKAWIPIGLDQLFPGDRSCADYAGILGQGADKCISSSEAYNPDDGVFSRRAFDGIIEALKQRMSGQFAASDVVFPIGVTVSKVNPERVSGTSFASLDVKTQRFAVVLDAKIVNGHLEFHQSKAKHPSLVGNQLFLPSKGGVVSHDDVIEVIKASSAFPLAFGPVELNYCLEAQLTDGNECTTPSKERFFDGGLFDNLPMGLALETIAHTPDPHQPHRLVYLDPDHRRNLNIVSKPNQGASAADSGHGIDYLLGLIGRFVSVARDYELQSNIRFAGPATAQTDGTSRYLPIFGGYLGAFAGFLARPFREHDFHAGVYDGLFYVSSLQCQETSDVPVERAKCLIKRFDEYLKLLNIVKTTATAYIAKRALYAELKDLVGEAAWQGFELANPEQLMPLGNVPQPSETYPGKEKESIPTADALMPAIFDGLQVIREKHITRGAEPGFITVLKQLDGLGSQIKRSTQDSCGAALFENRDALLGSIAKQIARRLVVLEGIAAEKAEKAFELEQELNPDAKEDFRAGPWVAGASQFIAESFYNGLEYDARAVWSPSTIPVNAHWFARTIDVLIPYYVTGDLKEGGLEAGYLPSLHLLWAGSGLAFPLAPLAWNRQEKELGGRAGVSFMWSGRWRGTLSRVEAGSYVRAHYHDLRGSAVIGAEVAVQALFNHIRISANMDLQEIGSASRSASAEKLWTIRLGASNFNGLAYWFGRVF
jgi:hypothetical protein